MRGLPQKFTKYGQQFEQLCRTSDTAVYLRHINGRQKSYEVAVVRVADKKPEKVNGALHFVTCEPYECYPSSEKWGTCGWTYTSEEDARAKFHLLSNPVFKLPAPPLYPIKVPAQRTALHRTAPFAPRVFKTADDSQEWHDHHDRSRRKLTNLQEYVGVNRPICPECISLCIKRLAGIDAGLNCRGVRELLRVLQRVLYTTEKGANLPLIQFRSSNTGRKLLDGLRQTALTTCVNLDSWKPLGYDFGNANARRFLPSSELLLANSSLEVADNIADYFAGRFAMLEVRCTSSVELAPDSGVAISPSVVARLEHGTGFRFNLSKACPIIDRLSEEKRVRVLRDGQRAIGCLRSTEAMHTRWSQKPCGRIYAADPAITNIPRILRPALEPINGGLVGEIEYQNFELRLAHAEAGLTVPPGDYARWLGEKTGLSREAVKAVLNPWLVSLVPQYCINYFK